jgi:uncharacterized damage-inducible protein DinB
MSGMKPIEVHDYLARTRRLIFEAIRPLGAEAWSRAFPIGPGTIGRTLTHIMISEWYYVQRVTRRDVPPYEQWPIRDEDPPPPATLESAWNDQAAETRAALGAVRDWDAVIEYQVTDDDGREMIVTTSAGGLFTQLAFHEMHHRAQVLNMLRQLGVTVGEIDFNAFFERREA